MKCAVCRGTGDLFGLDHRCGHCNGVGWLQFWTPAERAGLKAMGKFAQDMIDQHEYCEFPYDTIRAYVQAARKVKEAK